MTCIVYAFVFIILRLLFPQNYIPEQRLGARRSKSLQRGVYILLESNLMLDSDGCLS